MGVISGETGQAAEEMTLSFKAAPVTPWNCQLHTSSMTVLGWGWEGVRAGTWGRGGVVRGTKRGAQARCVFITNHSISLLQNPVKSGVNTGPETHADTLFKRLKQAV